MYYAIIVFLVLLFSILLFFFIVNEVEIKVHCWKDLLIRDLEFTRDTKQ